MKIEAWILSYIIGFVIVVFVFLEQTMMLGIPANLVSIVELIGGIMLIAGSSEAFVLAVQGISKNMHLTPYVSGIYASLAATIPELSVLTFLMLDGNYDLAWVLSLATIFVNSMVFSVYSLFLPKDSEGNYKLPEAIMWVGTDLLSMGAVISLAVGLSMLILHVFSPASTPKFTSDELFVFGFCLLMVFAAYLHRITKYYGKRETEQEQLDEESHGHITKKHVVFLVIMASIGALFGGEALSGFAEFSTDTLGMNFIQAALLLVVFGGTPEYIIVASSHSKNQIEIALSNAFGGIVQVFFVIFGYTLFAAALLGGSVTIGLFSVVLLFFAFPSMFILRVMITDDGKVNNLESISMIAVFIMMLYMLLMFGF